MTRDEAEIAALAEKLVRAMNARDLDAIMSIYVPGESLHVFDTMPPREFVGAPAYRKAFEGLLAAYGGPTTYTAEGVRVTAGADVGFVHWVCHMDGTQGDGTREQMNFRLTSCVRKIDGRWLVAHEHVSFPVDLSTMKAVVLS
ncbi:MAG TPA: SgcJ/EcaC family oxidoreductase [Candidatus Binatia bacterium]|jgi:uncharacterized protein (TIGR02246 family)|nr:SgcJ/EcaC family oxidoreductase [Candidatus Binatia bacterium]